MLILGSNLFTESVNEVYKVTELHYILNVGVYMLCSWVITCVHIRAVPVPDSHGIRNVKTILLCSKFFWCLMRWCECPPLHRLVMNGFDPLLAPTTVGRLVLCWCMTSPGGRPLSASQHGLRRYWQIAALRWPSCWLEISGRLLCWVWACVSTSQLMCVLILLSESNYSDSYAMYGTSGGVVLCSLPSALVT